MQLKNNHTAKIIQLSEPRRETIDNADTDKYINLIDAFTELIKLDSFISSAINSSNTK